MIALKPGTGLHTICFDLDGTLAVGTWPAPHIGEPIPAGVALLREMFLQGYECIIFTSRPAGHREAIANWLIQSGLDRYVYDIVTGKPRALAYIDDRAITFPEGTGPKKRMMRQQESGAVHEYVAAVCDKWMCVEVPTA